MCRTHVWSQKVPDQPWSWWKMVVPRSDDPPHCVHFIIHCLCVDGSTQPLYQKIEFAFLRLLKMKKKKKDISLCIPCLNFVFEQLHWAVLQISKYKWVTNRSANHGSSSGLCMWERETMSTNWAMMGNDKSSLVSLVRGLPNTGKSLFSFLVETVNNSNKGKKVS